MSDRPVGREIAIIGIAMRCAKAADVEQVWDNLRHGVEGLTDFTDAELRVAGVSEELIANPEYVKRAFVLDDVAGFDAEFFGFSPRDVELMDPQQRLFLELAWTALESSGYDPDRFPGRIGVYGGVGRNAYFLNNLARHPELLDNAIAHYLQIGNERDFPTTHVSFRLGLTGPSIDVQSACSTSGVAIHLACQALRGGECDMALAGGAKVLVPHQVGYLAEEGGPLSPDGHVRAFDADAAGMVRGSGGAMVLLKRLADAERDGDTILALVLSSATNNDGAARAGFTAPGVRGQADVIASAHAAAGVSASTISYVETHGTGTRLGDPIEVAGLTRAFRRSTDAVGNCALGSIKTNIGHLDAAATVAGVVKTVLALRNRELPPSLNFKQPNPMIEFENTPFYVQAELGPWISRGPRRAGVSSFGLGGSNAHLVLEEAPLPQSAPSARAWHLIPLSARTRPALAEAERRLAAYLRRNPGMSLADAAFTLQCGRRHFAWRRALAVSSTVDAASALEGADPRQLILGGPDRHPGPRGVAFMFPGGGAQYPGMGRDLYAGEPVFRDTFDQCATLLADDLGVDLRDLVYGDSNAGELERPSLALPALFAVEYASARLWQSWGIEPVALIGHSMGEYTAACLAEVMSLEDALALVVCRGRLFERLEAGAMLSIPLDASEVGPLLGDDLSIAAINRPGACVVSGSVQAIDAFDQALAARDLEAQKIHISVAAHSTLVEPILDEFRAFVATIPLQPPVIPYVSNLTGTWILDEEATNPDYWAQHLRHTVRFADGLATLLNDASLTLLEAGPGQTLCTFARQHPANSEPARVVASMRHPKEQYDDVAFIQMGLGRLWSAGVDVDFSRLWQGEQRRRLPLPTYPFERKRFWVDPPPRAAGAAAEAAAAPPSSQALNAPGLAPAAAFAASPAAGPVALDGATPDSLLEGVIQQQLQLMQQQLALLGVSPEAVPVAVGAVTALHGATNGSTGAPDVSDAAREVVRMGRRSPQDGRSPA